MVEQAQVTERPDVDTERGATLNQDLVQIIVTAVIDALRTHLGGRRVYVPVVAPAKAAHEIRTRDDAIRAAFNGRNMKEVCRDFGVSRATFYRITGGRNKKPAKRRAHAAGGAR